MNRDAGTSAPRRGRVALALAATLLAAACGGGGGGPDTAPQAEVGQVPASAGTDVRAYASYVGMLPASDDTEPLKLDRVEAPTSETEEPQPVGG
jgi:hypothetical protein